MYLWRITEQMMIQLRDDLPVSVDSASGFYGLCDEQEGAWRGKS